MVQYEDLTWELKDALETNSISEEAAEQCKQALIALMMQREAAVAALIEAYGEWLLNAEKARKKLEDAGLTNSDIVHCSEQYDNRNSREAAR